MFRVIEERARSAGRNDVAGALAGFLTRSRRLEKWLSHGDGVSSTKVLWRVVRRWRRLVLAGSLQ